MPPSSIFFHAPLVVQTEATKLCRLIGHVTLGQYVSTELRCLPVPNLLLAPHLRGLCHLESWQLSPFHLRAPCSGPPRAHSLSRDKGLAGRGISCCRSVQSPGMGVDPSPGSPEGWTVGGAGVAVEGMCRLQFTHVHEAPRSAAQSWVGGAEYGDPPATIGAPAPGPRVRTRMC